MFCGPYESMIMRGSPEGSAERRPHKSGIVVVGFTVRASNKGLAGSRTHNYDAAENKSNHTTADY